MAAVKELLLRPDVRLVTLTGPGGTGKTRLSLQVAQEVFDQFPQGVVFVSLADDSDDDQLISRIAQQLEVREGGRSLLQNLKDYLRDKQLLLVLDNFEQLVSAAPVVGDLLATAPRLKILTSSRIELNLQGEHEFAVPPLDLPAGELKVNELAQNEAVRLFVERAQSARPSFALTKDNAATIAEICRHLDGLPLALELAAARVKLLQPQAILSRLDDSLKLLTGGARDLPARHQTLRNTLEWSYELLDEAEKTLYARLGVFVGGFTLEAAEAVCNAEGRLDILEGIASLVNNSLLRQVETPEGEPRFSMLETIRAYAIERLEAGGELTALQQCHARYFGDIILNQAAYELYSAKGLYWLNWLEREHDNVRATLTWSLTNAQIEMAAGLAWGLTWFWYRRGYFSEGRMWAERALAASGNELLSPIRATALQANGLMALWQGDQATGYIKLQESLAIWQRQENEQWVAPILLANSIALINMGRESEALPGMEYALAILTEQGNAYFRVLTLVHLGNAELGLKHPEQARRWLEQGLNEARLLGDDWQISFALNNLGEVSRTLGQYDQARTYYEESEVLLRASSDHGDLARLVHNLGYVAMHEGDYARAEARLTESLAMFRQLGNRRGMAECLMALAGLRTRQGQARQGATLSGAAEAVLKPTGGSWWPADRSEIELTRSLMTSALNESEFAAALDKGRSLTLDQALHFAESDTLIAN